MDKLQLVLVMLFGVALWNAAKYWTLVSWRQYPRITAAHPRDDMVRGWIATVALLALGLLVFA